MKRPEVWSLSYWTYSRSFWAQSCAMCSKRETGPDVLLWSIPTSPILRFCGYHKSRFSSSAGRPRWGSGALQNVVCAVRSRLWEKCTKVLPRVVLQPGYTKTSHNCCTTVKQAHSRGTPVLQLHRHSQMNKACICFTCSMYVVAGHFH